MLSILIEIAWAFIFVKAGEGWWKIFIPFYGDFVKFRVAGKDRWFAAFLAGYIVYNVFLEVWFNIFYFGFWVYILGALPTGSPGDVLADYLAVNLETTGWMLAVVLAGLLTIAVSKIVLCFSVCRKFGKSRAFAAAAVFFPYVFLPHLAFGSAEYGTDGKTDAVS